MVKRCPLVFSLILTLLVIAFGVLSLSFPWYIVGRNNVSNDDDVVSTLYYWDGYKIKDGNITDIGIIYNEGDKSDLIKYKDLKWDNIQEVFAITLALVVIGTGLSCIAAIAVFFTLFTAKRAGVIVTAIFQFLSFAVILAGFFQFFRIQSHGFKKDDPFCINGSVGFEHDTYCKDFYGTSDSDTIELKFVGYIGWIMCIISGFFSLFAFIPSFVASKKKSKKEKPVKFSKV